MIFDYWDSALGKLVLASLDLSTEDLSVLATAGDYNFQSIICTRYGQVGYLTYSESGFAVQLQDLKGHFHVPNVQLTKGENIITAQATDEYGNVSSMSDGILITTNSGSVTDLEVIADDVYRYPPYPVSGERMAVNIVVSNKGPMVANDVDVIVYVANANGQLELIVSEHFDYIEAVSGELISAVWDSTGKAGENRLVVVIDPEDTITESDESNNMAIKDFIVTEKEGVAVTTSLDSSQYTAGQNVNIKITAWNNGVKKDVIVESRIEDDNNYPVVVFDPKSISLAYGTNQTCDIAWNTGSTYAGSYHVHSVLKDTSGAILAENTTPFIIIPDAAVDVSVVTDKAAYGQSENVLTSVTVRNIGANSIISALTATVSIADAAGAILFSDVKNLSNLMPGSSVDLTSSWNTGLAASGNYRVAVAGGFDGSATVAKAAAFSINAVSVLTGTVTASQPVVPLGSAEQLTYSIENSGNADAVGYTARISIIDPGTESVIESSNQEIDIPKNSAKTGQVILSTTGYALKTYTALLQLVSQDATKNVASTTFTVKDLTPPVISAVSPKTDGLYNSDMVISVFASDDASGVAKVEYQVDNSYWNRLPVADPAAGRYSGTWTPAQADNGTHTINFRATDNAGNISTPVSVGFDIDTAPPTLTLSTLMDDACTNNATLNIAGTVTDNVAVQSLTISGVAVAVNADGTFSQVISLVPGTNTITAVATDTAGNSTRDVRNIILDQDAPDITITDPADNSVTNEICSTVTGTIGKAATVNITINDGAPSPEYITDSDFSLPVTLVYGRNTILVTATDQAGNIGTAKRSVMLDNVNPTLAVTNPSQDTSTSEGQITLTGEVSDLTTVSVTVTVDGNTFTPGIADGKFGQVITFKDQKTYQINVAAVDLAGNQSVVQRNVIVSGNQQNIGVFGATAVSISGGYVDSYDSSKGSYSGVHGASVSVGTNSTSKGAINLSGGSIIYGDALVGPGGDPANVITTSGGAVINGSRTALSTLKNMTPMSDPGGGTPATFTNGTTLTTGAYRVSSISLSGSGIGTINGNVTLYITGSLSLSGSSQLVILPGGSLTVYLNGSLTVSGGSIVNETFNPHNLAIYGTSTCTSATYSGSSAFHGTIYAPAAKTTISGGNVYGSVIGRTVTISGGAAVHYDSSLGKVGP